MKIFYVGNFCDPWYTEVHVANTLERMGHQVTRHQEEPGNYFNAAGHDLFLYTRTWDWLVTMGDLEQLRELGIPSASFHLDLYVGLQREKNLDHDPFWRTDFVFQPDGDPRSLQIFKDRCINAHWLKPGVDRAECFISDTPLVRDIVFVGTKEYHEEWPYRAQLINWLTAQYGERFQHWGQDGLGVIRNDDLNRLYASTRIVIGDSLHLAGRSNYWSDRPYETLGRGGFLIMPNTPGLSEELTDKDMVYYEYGDLPRLKDLIDYYLVHDDERETIRQHGHDTVRSLYTYDERLTEMLSVIFS